MRPAIVVLLCGVVLAGCASAGAGAGATEPLLAAGTGASGSEAATTVGTSASPAATVTTPAPSASATPAASSPAARCPVPDSGTCLGTLTAGTYASSTFQPTLRYRVPAGWSNDLDVPGLFLLMPPGAAPPGDTITGDFIGVQTSVAAQATVARGQACSLNPAAGVGTGPQAIATWLARQPGLTVANRQAVTVGGLSGVAIDVTPTPGWTGGCHTPGIPDPVAPLVVGVAPSQFDHELPRGYAERDYLLAYGGGSLLIDLVDASGGSQLGQYAALVATFQFGSR